MSKAQGLEACAHVYIYIYMRVYTCVFTYVCIYIYVCVYINVYMYVYIYIYTLMYVCVCLYFRICMYMYMFVCFCPSVDHTMIRVKSLKTEFYSPSTCKYSQRCECREQQVLDLSFDLVPNLCCLHVGLPS